MYIYEQFFFFFIHYNDDKCVTRTPNIIIHSYNIHVWVRTDVGERNRV